MAQGRLSIHGQSLQSQIFFLEHLWVDNHLRPIVYIYIIPYYQATCLCKMLQNRQ